jgi:hypothetical protein
MDILAWERKSHVAAQGLTALRLIQRHLPESTELRKQLSRCAPRLFEIARLLVRLDHIARVIVNANHSVM